MDKYFGNELHKPVRKKFPNVSFLSKMLMTLWSADLVEMQKLAKQNKGYKYVTVSGNITESRYRNQWTTKWKSEYRR